MWNRKRPGNASLSLGGSRLRYPAVVRRFHPLAGLRPARTRERDRDAGQRAVGRASPRTHQGARSFPVATCGERAPYPRFCTLRVFLGFFRVSRLSGYPIPGSEQCATRSSFGIRAKLCAAWQAFRAAGVAIAPMVGHWPFIALEPWQEPSESCLHHFFGGKNTLSERVGLNRNRTASNSTEPSPWRSRIKIREGAIRPWEPVKAL